MKKYSLNREVEKEKSYTVAKTNTEITKYLGISNSSYFRRKVLDNLTIENDYLIISGERRIKYYKTNRDSVELG